MARSFLPVASLAALLAGVGLSLPAHAQFGEIFGGPPRPPAGVPQQRQQAPAPMGVPREMPPEEMASRTGCVNQLSFSRPTTCRPLASSDGYPFVNDPIGMLPMSGCLP